MIKINKICSAVGFAFFGFANAVPIYEEVPRSNDPFVFCTEGSQVHNLIISAIPEPIYMVRLPLPVLPTYLPPTNYPSRFVQFLDLIPNADRPDFDRTTGFPFFFPLPPFYKRSVRDQWFRVCLGRVQGPWDPAGTGSPPPNQVPFSH